MQDYFISLNFYFYIITLAFNLYFFNIILRGQEKRKKKSKQAEEEGKQTVGGFCLTFFFFFGWYFDERPSFGRVFSTWGTETRETKVMKFKLFCVGP